MRPSNLNPVHYPNYAPTLNPDFAFQCRSRRPEVTSRVPRSQSKAPQTWVETANIIRHYLGTLCASQRAVCATLVCQSQALAQTPCQSEYNLVSPSGAAFLLSGCHNNQIKTALPPPFAARLLQRFIARVPLVSARTAVRVCLTETGKAVEQRSDPGSSGSPKT